MFEDVDVGFMIERKKEEKRLLTGHVIRAANHKTFWEIHQEIRSVESNQAPSDAETVSWSRSAMLLPWPLSSVFKALFRMVIRNEPTVVTSMAGTVGISSVGMFGKGHAGLAAGLLFRLLLCSDLHQRFNLVSPGIDMLQALFQLRRVIFVTFC
jgi:hypothetical protein